jgi:hypothetical protein
MACGLQLRSVGSFMLYEVELQAIWSAECF